MKVELDTLKCAKMLVEIGINQVLAEGVVDTLTNTELKNLYSCREIEEMLTEAMQEVLDKRSREFDNAMVERRREFDQHERRFEMFERRFQRGLQWTVGTIFMVGFGLATYLTALIKLVH